MKPITEVRRIRAPFARPQGLAWDGEVFWMSSVATDRIYAVDPRSWTVKWETAAPGKPWGLCVLREELRVVCGEGPADNRFIHRCVPYRGFDAGGRMPCPDDCGSHLSWDGSRLQLSQWYPRKLLALDETGTVARSIPLNHEVCGQTWVDGKFFLVTTDDERTTDYWLTRLEPGTGADARSADLAHIPFAARALAFDGARFWTNHREQNETVCFTLPD